MKLTVELSGLLSNLKRMGANPVAIEAPDELPVPDLVAIDIELREGLDIPLDDVSSDSGVLSYKGRQILLYIPDQGGNIYAVIADGASGKKFHVTECATLRNMRTQNRFQRYVATNNIDGNFKVSGVDLNTGAAIKDQTARLRVCQNCLRKLNYNNSLKHPLI